MFNTLKRLLCLCLAGVVLANHAFAEDTPYTQWKGNTLVITDERPEYPPVEVMLYELATAERPESAAPMRPLRLVHVDIDKWDSLIVQSAHEHRVPAELIKAVMLRESGMNPNAQSPYAAGLMQFIPSTARAMGITNRFDPEQSVMGGGKYLRHLLNEFDGHSRQLSLAIAAYNAGPEAVRSAGYQVPPYSETQAYVPKVLQAYWTFLTQRPVPGAESLRPSPEDPLYPKGW